MICCDIDLVMAQLDKGRLRPWNDCDGEGSVANCGRLFYNSNASEWSNFKRYDL